VEDTNAMGEYAWAKVVWCVWVEIIEDAPKKLYEGLPSAVQFHGFYVVIQAIIE